VLTNRLLYDVSKQMGGTVIVARAPNAKSSKNIRVPRVLIAGRLLGYVTGSNCNEDDDCPEYHCVACYGADSVPAPCNFGAFPFFARWKLPW
jgi:hypothetical protein